MHMAVIIDPACIMEATIYACCCKLEPYFKAMFIHMLILAASSLGAYVSTCPPAHALRQCSSFYMQ